MSQKKTSKWIAKGQPKAKKHKSMDSDEDDEEPRIEPGTSSNTPTFPVLPLKTLRMKTLSTAMSTVQREDSRRTVFFLF